MTDNSPRLGLPYVRAGQLQKHVTVNEALTRLDGLVQTVIQSRALAAPPSVTDEGAIYVVAGAGSGAWSGFEDGTMVVAEMGQWRTFSPVEGQMAVVLDEESIIVFAQQAWQPLSQWLGGNMQVARLGIGTIADANNLFSARLNQALCTALPVPEGGTGDVRFSLNKSGNANTASLLFQSAGAGLGEIGLTGDRNVRLKVSSDGIVWREAFRVEHANGRMWFPQGAVRAENRVVAASTTLELPDWVRRVEAHCIGGGGGGASGQWGSAGIRRGGGGGGGGGAIDGAWTRDVLATTLDITIGTGGSAGMGGNGGDGGETIIRSGSTTILRAGGGRGGLLDGTGGEGGLGQVICNSGASSVGTGVPLPAVLAHTVAPGAGGAGGGISSANLAFAGSSASAGGAASAVGGGGAGGAGGPGGSGSGSANGDFNWCGGGGGGGAANTAGGGYAGGDGANRGGGGGGGGAGLTVGGKGGAGAMGIVQLTLLG